MNSYRLMLLLAILSTTTYAYMECTYSSRDQCPLSSLTTHTAVYPGGQTGCMYDSGSKAFYFEVFPGTGSERNKVLLFFQGGGACLSRRTCYPPNVKFINGVLKILRGRSSNGEKPQVFSPTIQYATQEGILDRTNPANPYRKWTTIHIGYCTADCHIGTNKHYIGGYQIHHNGANNVEAVLTWVMRNIANPSEFVVSGSSAGAFGAQMWSGTIIERYRAKGAQTRFTVLTDSFLGVLPDKAQGQIIKWWGACSVNFNWTSHPESDCHRGIFDYPNYIRDAIDRHAGTFFAFIVSNDDPIQRFFYCIAKHGYNIFRLRCLSSYGYQQVKTSCLDIVPLGSHASCSGSRKTCRISHTRGRKMSPPLFPTRNVIISLHDHITIPRHPTIITCPHGCYH